MDLFVVEAGLALSFNTLLWQRNILKFNCWSLPDLCSVTFKSNLSWKIVFGRSWFKSKLNFRSSFIAPFILLHTTNTQKLRSNEVFKLLNAQLNYVISVVFLRFTLALTLSKCTFSILTECQEMGFTFFPDTNSQIETVFVDAKTYF